MRAPGGQSKAGVHSQRHIKTDAERRRELELKLKGQVEGLLVVPIYLVIIAWVLYFLGWWQR